MSELSGISSHQCRLTSKTQASLESIRQKKKIEGLSELKQFENQMQQMHRGLVLAKEIQRALETMLQNLSSE